MGAKKNTVAVAFGQVLRTARTGVGISQEDLALRCGIDRTYISLLERGLRQPTLTTVFSLCDELGADPSELIQQTRKQLRS